MPGARRERGSPSDRGSAIVEFTLVAPLLVLLALGIVQVSLALHVRSTLTSAAVEGARAAALAGADPGAGLRRTRSLLADNVAASVVRDVTVHPGVIDGLDVMEVRIEADLPLVGLLGPSVLSIRGHALRESAA